MTPFLAVMAMIGFLVTAVAVGWPITWAIDTIYSRFANYMFAKHVEWDAAYRD